MHFINRLEIKGRKMAIQDDDQKQKVNVQQGAASQNNQPAAGGWGFFNMGNAGTVTRTATSEALTKAHASLQSFYEKNNLIEAPYETIIVPVDNRKETNLHLSSIVICVRNGQDKLMGVSYHTLMLEGSGEALMPRIENYNGRQLSIDRVTGDVYDRDYQDTVAAVIARAFPGIPARAIDSQVVPRTFNFDDVDALRNLAVNAIMPCTSDLAQRDPSFTDLDLSRYQRDAQLIAQVNFNEPDMVDYVGLPVRNDISITLSANSNNKQNANAINSQDRSMTVSRLGGFIDLMWAPQEAQITPYGMPPQGVQPKFAARLVLTNMENVMKMTVASQLLALVTSLSLREGTNWYPYYTPRHVTGKNKDIDLRDIGAINLEANVLNEAGGYGARIDTKSASFNNIELGRLISAAIRPGLTYSMDVSECGSDTWYNGVFAAAAAGNVAAANAILEAANKLSGSVFGQLYNSNEAPVIINDDRIHLGYYVGADGQKHDLRKIDYLAVMAINAEKDKGAAQAWSDTFLRTDIAAVQRLDARKKMITDMVRGDVVFTGFAQRVTFSNRFLESLAKACQQVGLDVRVSSPSFGTDYQSSRGVANFLPQTSVGMGHSGIFQQGFGNGQPAFGQTRQYGGNRAW
jgi:hypothetical protein